MYDRPWRDRQRCRNQGTRDHALWCRLEPNLLSPSLVLIAREGRVRRVQYHGARCLPVLAVSRATFHQALRRRELELQWFWPPYTKLRRQSPTMRDPPGPPTLQ